MVSAFSIALPVIFSMARLKRFGKRYRSLLFLFTTGLLNEVTSYWMIKQYRNNLPNSNIYTLIEYLLLTWLFWDISKQKFSRVRLALIAAMIIWIADNFWWHTLAESNIIFRTYASLMLVSLSMDKINQLLMGSFGDPYKNTDLLLCLSLLGFHTYRVWINIFHLFVKSMTPAFFVSLWLILCCMNLLANITYSIAILCIPKQKNYIRY